MRKKELEDKVEQYWTCDRCEIDSLGERMCPCPRGSCDAICMGEVVTTKTIYFNKTKWLYQYLVEEDSFYLTELHSDEGILSELFFKTYDELITYISEHNIVLEVKK